MEKRQNARTKDLHQLQAGQPVHLLLETLGRSINPRLDLLGQRSQVLAQPLSSLSTVADSAATSSCSAF